MNSNTEFNGKTGLDETGLSKPAGSHSTIASLVEPLPLQKMPDLRTAKQKAIDFSAAFISLRIWGVLHHGDKKELVSIEELRKILTEQFADVHEVQEDDGR